MNIGNHTFEEYIEKVRSFHGFAAPGVVIGGFMVDLAYKYLPEKGLFDAICETDRCLPDAIQLLTPCTIGNNWLRVINFGRFVLTLYDKHNGDGVRVFVEPSKLDSWSEIKNWFFKSKPKQEQNNEILIEQIREAGATICGLQYLKVIPSFLKKQHREEFAICSRCHEAYPLADDELCLSCKGKAPYQRYC